MNPCRCRAAAVALLCLLSSAALAQPRTAGGVTLRDGIVADPQRAVAYVMTLDGGVGAVDLATGAIRWRSADAAKPLAIVENVVVSQAEPKSLAARHTLELVTLNDTERGALGKRNAVELPADVRVSVGQTLDGTFTAAARPSDGSVIVTWRFVRGHRSGMSPEILEDERKAAGLREAPQSISGALRMELSTGKMTTLDSVPAVAAPRWAIPGVEIEGAPRPQFESADGRHVLVSERVADDRTFDKYRWTAYDRATKRKLGELRTHVSFAPFLVVRGSVLVYWTTPYEMKSRDEEPAKLRGVSLETGRELWSVPVREVVWRGPTPP